MLTQDESELALFNCCSIGRKRGDEDEEDDDDEDDVEESDGEEIGVDEPVWFWFVGFVITDEFKFKLLFTVVSDFCSWSKIQHQLHLSRSHLKTRPRLNIQI